jgi:flagella basal body P-ring formation protein FlgA
VIHAQQAIQPLETIRAAAEDHVRTQLGAGGDVAVSAGSLDPRLRLAPCAGPLEASSMPAGLRAARVTVGVRCTQGATWTVYVPVSIESEVQVLVLRHAAARGAQLTEADVMVQTRRVPGFGGGYVADPRQLAGRTLRRPLPAGAVLTPDALEADIVVRRGQQVTLLAASNGIQVRASGRALADGRAGERLKVQNERSNVVVEGVVESPGVIRVTP